MTPEIQIILMSMLFLMFMFLTEYCQLIAMPNIFKAPKKIPEEKVPVPVQKKEAPLVKGTLSCLTLNFFSMKTFMCLCLDYLSCLSIKVCSCNPKYPNYIFKVPEVQKEVPEKKIPDKKVSVTKKEAVPPAKGILGKIFNFHGL